MSLQCITCYKLFPFAQTNYASFVSVCVYYTLSFSRPKTLCSLVARVVWRQRKTFRCTSESVRMRPSWYADDTLVVFARYAWKSRVFKYSISLVCRVYYILCAKGLLMNTARDEMSKHVIWRTRRTTDLVKVSNLNFRLSYDVYFEWCAVVKWHWLEDALYAILDMGSSADEIDDLSYPRCYLESLVKTSLG